MKERAKKATEPQGDLTLKGLAEAFALHQSGRFEDAERAYAKVLSTDPDDAVALINAGALALARDDVDRAVARLSRAVESVPNNAAALNNLRLPPARAARTPARGPSISTEVAPRWRGSLRSTRNMRRRGKRWAPSPTGRRTMDGPKPPSRARSSWRRTMTQHNSASHRRCLHA